LPGRVAYKWKPSIGPEGIRSIADVIAAVAQGGTATDAAEKQPPQQENQRCNLKLKLMATAARLKRERERKGSCFEKRQPKGALNDFGDAGEK
jgi:hypothetical protein